MRAGELAQPLASCGTWATGPHALTGSTAELALEAELWVSQLEGMTPELTQPPANGGLARGMLKSSP